MHGDKEAEQAIRWLASEHNFFVELKQDLTNLKQDLAQAKTKETVRDIKRAFQDFRYLASSEKRFNLHESHVEEALRALREQKLTISGSIGQIQDLLQRLHTEASNLIRNSSFYEGRIRELLNHLKQEITESNIEQAHAVLMELTQIIDHAQQWIGALSIDLQKAREILSSTLKDTDPSYENFQNPQTRALVESLFLQDGFSGVTIRDYETRKPQILAYFGPRPQSLLYVELWTARDRPQIIRAIFRFASIATQSWDNTQYQIEFDVNQYNKKGISLKHILETMIRILRHASESKGYQDVSGKIDEELRSSL